MKHSAVRTAEHCAALSKALKGGKMPPRTAEHCAKISLAHTGKKPTEETKEKMRLSHFKGQDEYIGPWTYKFEHDEIFRTSIKERDNYQCQECGEVDVGVPKSFHIHHIDFDKRNDDIDNLIYYCAKCHRNIHVEELNV